MIKKGNTMLPQNILIVRLSAIGDVLHCTPVSRALREQYPDAKLSWIVSEKAQDILVGNPFLDEVLVWNKDQWKQKFAANPFKGYRSLQVLSRTLRQLQFDLVVDVHAQLLPGLITWGSGAPIRVGFSNAKEMASLFYNKKVPRDGSLPITRQYLGALGALGISAPQAGMIMPVAPENEQKAAAIWSENNIGNADKVVVLNSSTTWPTKCWPPEYFSQLGNYLLQEPGVKILLTGAKADIPLVQQIKNGINGEAIDIAGHTSLKDLAAVIRKCDLFITGDTGPLHMAAAVGTPTLSLFGPTDPRIYAPEGEQHVSLLSPAPCQLCRKRTCDHFVCMAQIKPELVYQKAVELLRKTAGCRYRNTELLYRVVPLKRMPV